MANLDCSFLPRETAKTVDCALSVRPTTATFNYPMLSGGVSWGAGIEA